MEEEIPVSVHLLHSQVEQENQSLSVAAAYSLEAVVDSYSASEEAGCHSYHWDNTVGKQF